MQSELQDIQKHAQCDIVQQATDKFTSTSNVATTPPTTTRLCYKCTSMPVANLSQRETNVHCDHNGIRSCLQQCLWRCLQHCLRHCLQHLSTCPCRCLCRCRCPTTGFAFAAAALAFPRATVFACAAALAFGATVGGITGGGTHPKKMWRQRCHRRLWLWPWAR